MLVAVAVSVELEEIVGVDAGAARYYSHVVRS